MYRAMYEYMLSASGEGGLSERSERASSCLKRTSVNLVWHIAGNVAAAPSRPTPPHATCIHASNYVRAM